MLSALESCRRNSVGSHLSSLRRVSKKPLSGILITRNGWIMLLLGSIRSIMRICIKTDNVFFRKPTFNGLYTPFGSPVSGGQKPSLPLKKVFRIPPSPFSQRELHILTKPSLLRREGCNRPPVLRTASL